MTPLTPTPSRISLGGASLGALLLALLSLSAVHPLAHGDKKHGHSHEHAAKPKAEKAADSEPSGPVHELLQTLNTQMGAVEKAWKDLEHDALHTSLEQLDSSVARMQAHLSDLAADKKKRVQGYLKNLSRLSHQLHQAADEKKDKVVESTVKKWKAQFRMIESQFGVKTKSAEPQKSPETGTKASARATFAQDLAKAKGPETLARESLAKKDSVKAHETLMSLHGVLHAMNPAELSLADQAVWKKEEKAIMDALHPLGKDNTLKSLEPVMLSVSQSLRSLWKHFEATP